MSDLIRVSLVDLYSEVTKMETALSTLGSGSNQFTQNASTSLEGFNSDFASQAKKTLEDMSGAFIPAMYTKAEKFYNALMDTVSVFAQKDQECAQKN